MANRQHLNKLSEGRESWNNWRDQNPDTKPDLTEANLAGFDFEGYDFYRTNFCKVNLSKADLKHLADDFLSEKEVRKTHKYLRLFGKVKFPYPYQPILRIAQGRNTRKHYLVRLAAK